MVTITQPTSRSFGGSRPVGPSSSAAQPGGLLLTLRAVKPFAAQSRRARSYSRRMAKGGPQAIPGVTLRDAYRFSTSGGADDIEGTVFKALPRRIVWEARVDGTSIDVTGGTRRDAVERAVAEARRQRGF